MSFGPLIVRDTSGKIISETVNVPEKLDKSMMSPEFATCIANFRDSVDRVAGVIVSADSDIAVRVDKPATKEHRFMSFLDIFLSNYKI